MKPLFFHEINCDGMSTAAVLALHACMQNTPRAKTSQDAPAGKPWFTIQAKAESKSAEVFIFDTVGRSEERRVGKECRSRWTARHETTKVHVTHTS